MCSTVKNPEPPKFFPVKPRPVIKPKIKPEVINIAGVDYYELANPTANNKYILVSKYKELWVIPKKKKRYSKA